MYRELATESMPFARSVALSLTGRCLGLILLLLVCLTGCGVKTLSGDDPVVVVKQHRSESTVLNQQTPGTGYLPVDDGIPLTTPEKKALVSTGDFDKELSPAELRDVELHFKSLIHKGRQTVVRGIERANAYMPYIKKVLREQHLPQELAYLAFVESVYNPVARSRSGALGMWQFVSGTGRHCGMRQDSWIDERRDPYTSTRAAAAYLTELNQTFNDWHLAISAYNAGPGKIGRGLAASGAKTFFELRSKDDVISNPKDKMTDENKQYLTKFLAVCKIMRNLNKLGFPPLNVDESTIAVELRARPGTDLRAMSKSLGMDWNTFFSHNTGYMRNLTPPNASTSVRVPPHLSNQAQAFLKGNSSKNYAGWKPYTVAKGDSLSRIARRTGTAVADIRRVNQINEPLLPGTTLLVPGSGKAVAERNEVRTSSKSAVNAPAPLSRGTISASVVSSGRTAATQEPAKAHVVQSGDTLYSIAKTYSVKHQDVIAANNLGNADIQPGQRLKIPGALASADRRSSSDSRSSVQRPAAPRAVTYKVQNGDTVWAIARKFNVSPTTLLALNNMDRTATLKPGDMVRVAEN